MRIAVLADTHIPKRAKTLPESAFRVLRSADVILHAGDVLTREFLKELETIAPLHAVRGNNDLELAELPQTVELDFDGVNVAMIHDSGQKKDRAKRMRAFFPRAQIVVFGHSHIPINVFENDLLLFNPGSPTDRRTQPHLTMGMVEVAGGVITSAEIIVLSK